MHDDSGFMALVSLGLVAALFVTNCSTHDAAHKQGLKDAAIGTWVAEMDPRTGEWSYRKVEEPEVEEPAHAD